jgi:hypothetical protein
MADELETRPSAQRQDAKEKRLTVSDMCAELQADMPRTWINLATTQAKYSPQRGIQYVCLQTD